MLSALPKGKRVGQRNDRTADKVRPAYIMRLEPFACILDLLPPSMVTLELAIKA